MIGIYKITSPSGKVYIGQSWNIVRRWKEYEWYNGAGQPLLHRSLLKYGVINHAFEIIHELPADVSQATLNEYETLYWSCYKDCGALLLNVREPGSNGKLSINSVSKRSATRKANRFTITKEHADKIVATKRATGAYAKGWDTRRKNNTHQNLHNRRQILHIETGTVYDSVSAAIKASGVVKSTIYRHIKEGLYKYL